MSCDHKNSNTWSSRSCLLSSCYVPSTVQCNLGGICLLAPHWGSCEVGTVSVLQVRRSVLWMQITCLRSRRLGTHRAVRENSLSTQSRVWWPSSLKRTTVQANLGDTVGSVPHHHNKADKGSHVNFLVFQCISKLCLYCGLLIVQ